MQTAFYEKSFSEIKKATQCLTIRKEENVNRKMPKFVEKNYS